MRTISLITALACFLPLSHAHSFETDYALSFGGFYGYTDYNRPKHNLYKNNNLNSTLNAYGRISHSFNNNYEASLIGYFMIDSAKELENYNQGKWGEEVFAQITSPYGELTIGQDYNVAYNFSIGAPTVGSYHNSEITNFINNPNWYAKNGKSSYKTLNSTYINTDGSSLKLNYVTPSFLGLKFGASYIPKVHSRSSLVSNSALYDNQKAYVLGGLGEWFLSGYEISASIGYADFDKNTKEYSTGFSIYRKGWTFGASYRQTNASKGDYTIDKTTLFDTYREGQAYNIGLKYEIGPFSTGVSYFDSKADNFDYSNKITSFSNAYKLNKNTTISLSISQLKATTENSKTKGYAGIIGLEIELWKK